MMSPTRVLRFTLVLSGWLLWAAGCSSESSGASVARGALGESCSARADCESGLICLDNRCLTQAEPSSSESDAGTYSTAVPTDTRGSAGESCTRRADCTTGLMCIANVCVDGPLPEQTSVSPLGDRGESCQARNDCAAGLSCLQNRCAPGDNTLEILEKQCFRVQCELDEDCCESFVANVNCPTWKQACSDGDSAACSSFKASCECTLACENSACVAVRKCAVDSDCSLVNERCFSGRCAQCASDSDCAGTGQHCVNAVCRVGCERNEQCPLFAECKASECVHVGCKSDRECSFALKTTLARCLDAQCVVPCTSDAQCGELHACRDEQCVFVGCESDEECRAFLNLASSPSNERAVCRQPDR